MNGWTFVPLAQARAMPWKNGGGITHELLAGPDARDWRWRLSVAQVDSSGPFSSFPGVHRWFAVLDGAGVVLEMDGGAHRLTCGSAPLSFDGAAVVDCVLIDGATQDFNLMVRGGSGAMLRVIGQWSGRVGRAGLAAVYAVEPAVIELAGERTAVPAQTLAWRLMDADAPVQVTSSSALWMEADA
jgi:environmental stress-induced protein Ves